MRRVRESVVFGLKWLGALTVVVAFIGALSWLVVGLLMGFVWVVQRLLGVG